jgi:hypothetical protein
VRFGTGDFFRKPTRDEENVDKETHASSHKWSYQNTIFLAEAITRFLVALVAGVFRVVPLVMVSYQESTEPSNNGSFCRICCNTLCFRIRQLHWGVMFMAIFFLHFDLFEFHALSNFLSFTWDFNICNQLLAQVCNQKNILTFPNLCCRLSYPSAFKLSKRGGNHVSNYRIADLKIVGSALRRRSPSP